MHELPVTERILNLVLKHAVANHVTRVVRIYLEIGELSDLEDEWLQNYFNYLSKDTVAANAELSIERTPIVLECTSCGHSFNCRKEELGSIRCSKCEETQCRMTSGRGYFIKNMEAI